MQVQHQSEVAENKWVTGSYNLRTSLITNVAKMQEARISLEGLAAFGKMCSDRVKLFRKPHLPSNVWGTEPVLVYWFIIAPPQSWSGKFTVRHYPWAAIMKVVRQERPPPPSGILDVRSR